jgi:Mrp family chromosome partitioning ATPase
MSTNQAFIKAYRHDQAEPAPASPLSETAAARTRSGAIAATGPAFASASSDAWRATVTYVSPASSYGDDAEVEGRPAAPAAAIAEVEASPYAPDASAIYKPTMAARPASPAPTVRMPHSPASVKRPLSAFRKQATTIAQPSPMLLRPGTTISAFRWPSACRNLLQQHGQLFDRLTETLLAQVAQGRSLIGILGLFRGVGCTTTTLCLAARLADRSRSVIAVDGHFQAPQFSACLDAEPTAWWQDVLERGAALSDAMVRAEHDDLDLLPLDPYTRATPPALQLAATAGALRHAYDIVLVDLGTFFDPTSQTTALDLVRHMRIDAALAVAAPGSLDPRDLETVADRLEECGCELLGTVENRAQR